MMGRPKTPHSIAAEPRQARRKPKRRHSYQGWAALAVRWGTGYANAVTPAVHDKAWNQQAARDALRQAEADHSPAGA